MIRYISEKEVNLTPMRLNRNTYSLERSLQLNQHIVEVPEENPNSTHALKSLRKVNDQSLLLKSRLSVLQIQEEKNDFRAFCNQQRYKFHQQMRDEIERTRQHKAHHLKKILETLQHTQEQAKTDRLQHSINMKKANLQLLSSKQQQYQITKEQEQQIQEGVQLFRREENKRKKERNYQIRKYQRSQKLNVKQYFENKSKELIKSDIQESLRVSRIREERVMQIEELSKLEALMIQRQARSKMSNEQSESRLKQLLYNKKPLSTSHSTKLPTLTNHDKKQSQQDLFIL